MGNKWQSYAVVVQLAEVTPQPVTMLSYSPGLARVQVSLTAAGGVPAGTTGTVERSLDQIRWVAVQGAQGLTHEEDPRPVDDYTFAPGVVNHYRLRLEAVGSTVAIYTDSVTAPDIDAVWVKNVAFPFLNLTVVVADYGDVQRPARGAMFDVVGASDPVAVTDVRGSRNYDLQVLTASIADAEEFDQVLSQGGVVYVQTPEDCDVPDGHYRVGDTTQARMARKSKRRVFTLPLTGVRPPAGSVVGVTITCQAVANRYATCQDLFDTGMTCDQVLDLVADPEDLVV